MRDVVTHNYDSVDLSEIWDVICDDLPELLGYISPLIEDRKTE